MNEPAFSVFFSNQGAVWEIPASLPPCPPACLCVISPLADTVAAKALLLFPLEATAHFDMIQTLPDHQCCMQIDEHTSHCCEPSLMS